MARFTVVDKEALEYYHKTQVVKKLDGNVEVVNIDELITSSGIECQSDLLKNKSYIDVYLSSVVPENCKLIRVIPGINTGFDIAADVNEISGYIMYDNETGTISCTVTHLSDTTASWTLQSAYYYK